MANLIAGELATTGGAIEVVNAALATDESTATGSSYAQAGVYSGGQTATWTWDLGAPAVVTQARMAMAELAPNYSILSSPDGTTWTERVNDSTDWIAEGGGSVWHEAAIASVDARYWRMQFGPVSAGYNGGNYMTELELIGEYSAPVDPDPDPPDYEAPAPAGPVLEIYTADPDGDRWGIALWGTATWGDAGWQDVTPRGVRVAWSWGADDPAYGMLARPTAANVDITTFDDTRDLDPANESSPYVGYLVPGLPIRLNHRARTIRTGHVETMAYSYANRTGRIRASDALGRMGATVPEGDLAGLSATLWARTADVIAAAGIGDVDIRRGRPQVDAPLSDPPTGERSALEHVILASQEVRAILWVYPDGRLSWRFHSAPLERGRTLAAPELIDLTSNIDHRGRFSTVRALDDDGVTITERSYTPTPTYGRTIYERGHTTINSADWAAAILADRAIPGVRYVPGEVRPRTADAVEYYASIEAGEKVTIVTDDVTASGIVLGGTITVYHLMGGDAPIWRFTFAIAPADPTFLVSDQAGDPLVSDADSDDYLSVG